MNPANLRHRQEFVHGKTTFSPPFTQRLHRDTDPNFIPIFETVGNGLGCRGYPDINPIDFAMDHTGRECLPAKTNDMQWGIPLHRKPGFAVDGNPNLMRGLRGKLMKNQGGEKADDPLRYPHCGLGKAMVLGYGITSHSVNATTYAGNSTLRERSLEGLPRNPELREFTRTDHRLFSEQRSQLGIGGSSHKQTIQYVGTCLQVPSFRIADLPHCQAFRQEGQKLLFARDDPFGLEDARLNFGVVDLPHETFISGHQQQ